MEHGSWYKTDDVTAPTCTDEGYTIYICKNDPDCIVTDKQDYTRRIAHPFTEYVDGRLVCGLCDITYRDVTTYIEGSVADGELKIDEETSLDWELKGYKAPTEAIAIVGGGSYDYVVGGANLDITNGIIKLSSEAQAIYTIVVEFEGGTKEFTVDSADAYFDLYVNKEGEVNGIAGAVTKVTVTATANAGYKFVGWYVDDVKKSSDATYTFAATADVTLVAEFEKVEYTVATDANGNLLTPHFVNGINWELSEGQLFLYDGTGAGFLLFDDELNANRIETTMVVRDNETGYHGDKRYGVVFALTDYDGDSSFTYGTDVSYYWAFINTWGHVEIRKMGRHQGWTVIGSSPAPITTIKTGVNLVVEWDDNGHIVVYADGNLVIDITDKTDPLNGNLYGLYAVKHWNHASDPTVTDAYYTSFIAGVDASGGPDSDENVTVNVETTEGGTVAGAGEYELGTSVTLTATPNAGYKFIGWFVGDELVSEDAELTFTAEENCEFIAKFEPVCGDANGDGTLNDDDVALIREYIARFDYDTNTSSVNVEAGADFNGDGEINMKDVILLRQYLANNG
jgi:uncharacterized repeat protein (TIGR02543 family)